MSRRSGALREPFPSAVRREGGDDPEMSAMATRSPTQRNRRTVSISPNKYRNRSNFVSFNLRPSTRYNQHSGLSHDPSAPISPRRHLRRCRVPSRRNLSGGDVTSPIESRGPASAAHDNATRGATSFKSGAASRHLHLTAGRAAADVGTLDRGFAEGRWN